MKEIQTLEVSCFVQATEDEERIIRAVNGNLAVTEEPTKEALDGHFGNKIIHLVWSLKATEAWKAFSALILLLDDAGIRDLERNLDMYIDDHGSLYVRLNKQTMIRGIALIGTSDPIRIKVKPKGFILRGRSPRSFYEDLIRKVRTSG